MLLNCLWHPLFEICLNSISIETFGNNVLDTNNNRITAEWLNYLADYGHKSTLNQQLAFRRVFRNSFDNVQSGLVCIEEHYGWRNWLVRPSGLVEDVRDISNTIR